MAINNLAKGVALLGGAGGVVGGYSLINHLSSNPKKEKAITSVEDRLKKEGYTLLNFGNISGDEWNKIKGAYEKENDDGKRFSGVNKSGNDTLSGIRDACLRYLKGDSTDESIYQLSRRWCIVPISVKSKLGNSALLKAGTGDSEDNNKWDKLVSKNESESANKFVNFSSGADANKKREEIKKQCETKAAIETTDATFDETLRNVSSWCTSEATI
ncbi:hypothetical protein MHC_01760 [Mycoplasma haemocanis str. Illinois]|uniref:Uncharacterized protein n=1 Tax=Mycoplasma haemocanis (strain Illinois) TaxID=1111676 RepID=H6N6E6_MYCHN|nr:hypothetical protein [Mycoplasma haemocanis]AEW45218.1 hypothetical protein MHC_01760 [Mycoplasma haemocanis str. Illinois]